MLNFNYYLPIYHFSISVTDIFAKNMSFKSKFQIISNIAFKFRYIGLHQSVNHVGDLFSRCWILLRRKNRVIGVLYMFTEIFLKRRTHKEPVIIYVEVGVGGGGEEGGGVKAISDWLGGGLNFFIKKFRGVSSLVARYILRGVHWPR